MWVFLWNFWGDQKKFLIFWVKNFKFSKTNFECFEILVWNYKNHVRRFENKFRIFQEPILKFTRTNFELFENQFWTFRKKISIFSKTNFELSRTNFELFNPKRPPQNHTSFPSLCLHQRYCWSYKVVGTAV